MIFERMFSESIMIGWLLDIENYKNSKELQKILNAFACIVRDIV